MPRCGACGASVDDDDRFCTACGNELAGDRPDGDGAPDGRGDRADRDATDRRGDPPDGPALGEPATEGVADTWGTPSGGDGSRDSDTGQSDDPGRAAGTRRAAGSAAVEAGDAATRADPDGPVPFDDGPLRFAAGYGLRNGYDDLAVASIFEFFGWIVPPVSLLVRGFAFQITGAAARGRARPPTFADPGRLAFDGVRALAVLLAWTLAMALAGTATAVVAAALAWPAWVGLVPWLVVGAVGLPASLTAAAAHGGVGAGFSPGVAGAFAFSGIYVATLLRQALLAVLVALLAVLSLVTVAGPVVVVTWGIFATAALWGVAYRRAVADGTVPAASVARV